MIDIGVRHHAAERFENLFSAPHAEQPVVNQGDPHLELQNSRYRRSCANVAFT